MDTFFVFYAEKARVSADFFALLCHAVATSFLQKLGNFREAAGVVPLERIFHQRAQGFFGKKRKQPGKLADPLPLLERGFHDPVQIVPVQKRRNRRNLSNAAAAFHTGERERTKVVLV